MDFKEMRSASDRELLELTLVKAGGSCKAATDLLGVNVATVYRMIRTLELTHLLKRPHA